MDNNSNRIDKNCNKMAENPNTRYNNMDNNNENGVDNKSNRTKNSAKTGPQPNAVKSGVSLRNEQEEEEEFLDLLSRTPSQSASRSGSPNSQFGSMVRCRRKMEMRIRLLTSITQSRAKPAKPARPKKASEEKSKGIKDATDWRFSF